MFAIVRAINDTRAALCDVREALALLTNRRSRMMTPLYGCYRFCELVSEGFTAWELDADPGLLSRLTSSDDWPIWAAAICAAHGPMDHIDYDDDVGLLDHLRGGWNRFAAGELTSPQVAAEFKRVGTEFQRTSKAYFARAAAGSN
jgi:hypothetical protein